MATPRKTSGSRTTAKGTKPAARKSTAAKKAAEVKAVKAAAATRSAARRKPTGGVTSAKDWKSSARIPVELELPSGNVCLALNKGMQAFLDEGTVPNSLMPIVQAAIKGAETGKKPEQLFNEATDDESLLTDMLTLTDSVVLACIRQPEILPAPTARVWVDDTDEEKGTRTVTVEYGRPVLDVITNDNVERFPDLLYVDEVDLDDKLFVFQWAVGGTANVEKFREEFDSALENVSGGEGVASET